MITQKQVDALRDIDGCEWISALRPGAINKLVQGGAIQQGLFDERNLFELTHPDFPDERLVACRNPDLADRRAAKRNALLAATTRELERVSRMVNGRRLHGRQAIETQIQKVLKQLRRQTQQGELHGKGAIGVRVGKVINKYKMSKHFLLDIKDRRFAFEIDQEKVAAEAALDGLQAMQP